MKTSTATGAIIPAFVKALAAMDDIPRTEKVSAGPMRYSFAPLNVVLEQIRPHLRDNGLAVSQVATTSEGVFTFLFHESGEWIEFDPLLIIPAGGTPQAVGSAITYSRRYSLLAILGLSTEDDDGAASSVAATSAVEDPRHGRVDATMRRLTGLSDEQKTEMKAFAEREDRKLSGKALFEDPEWLGMVESYLDVLESDDATDPTADDGPY